MYAIQRENGIVMNADLNVKSLLIGVLVKMITLEILVNVVVSMTEHVNLVNI